MEKPTPAPGTPGGALRIPNPARWRDTGVAGAAWPFIPLPIEGLGRERFFVERDSNPLQLAYQARALPMSYPLFTNPPETARNPARNILFGPLAGMWIRNLFHDEVVPVVDVVSIFDGDGDRHCAGDGRLTD